MSKRFSQGQSLSGTVSVWLYRSRTKKHSQKCIRNRKWRMGQLITQFVRKYIKLERLFSARGDPCTGIWSGFTRRPCILTHRNYECVTFTNQGRVFTAIKVTNFTTHSECVSEGITERKNIR